MSRTDTIATFIKGAGWGDAVAAPLAGDASTRRYTRYRRGDGTSAMLMDADPALGTPTRPFVDVARHLTALGLAAPEILEWDDAKGLLLLEDFGDDVMARVIEREPGLEQDLYDAAVDALVTLHQHPAPRSMPTYDHREMGRLAALAVTWYLQGTEGRDDPSGASRLAQEVTELLDRAAPGYAVLALRDFHAENLIWLPARTGPQRMGLLDFQDAGACHPAYDLVSLTEDARRDVPAAVREAAMDRYIQQTNVDAEAFQRAAAACAAQRNLRILFIFARLSMHFAKPHYVDLIPRTWDHLMRDIDHPDLAALKRLVLELLPEPTPQRLARLKEVAGQWPTP